ncbi:hypothetical protein CDAR_22431 [Caerostris darwini]|uniref:Uncharacterized protein n=1 Tax=Caerostris darwini TaxID=1538125 RepID=A0AAV4UB01_9ARAC|nr:hypothetical protein CDAR_22431 [Caerostris darwini]
MGINMDINTDMPTNTVIVTNTAMDIATIMDISMVTNMDIPTNMVISMGMDIVTLKTMDILIIMDMGITTVILTIMDTVINMDMVISMGIAIIMVKLIIMATDTIMDMGMVTNMSINHWEPSLVLDSKLHHLDTIEMEQFPVIDWMLKFNMGTCYRKRKLVDLRNPLYNSTPKSNMSLFSMSEDMITFLSLDSLKLFGLPSDSIKYIYFIRFTLLELKR